MDPNIMRHLNVDRESDYTRNLMATLMPSADKKGEAKPLSIAEFPIRKESERPKDQPAPTFNEKKKLRETLFLVMDESAIEETRIVSASNCFERPICLLYHCIELHCVLWCCNVLSLYLFLSQPWFYWMELRLAIMLLVLFGELMVMFGFVCLGVGLWGSAR